MVDKVFIWDLDETLIIFHSLLTGSFAREFQKDPNVALSYGLCTESFIFDVADSRLFFKDLERYDVVHVDDVTMEDCEFELCGYDFSTDNFSMSAPPAATTAVSSSTVTGSSEWHRKLSLRYQRIREIYNNYSSDLPGLFGNSEASERWSDLRSEIDDYTDSWLSLANQVLEVVQSRPAHVNVLVTTTHLVPAVAKLLLFGLGSTFSIDNIYSASKAGKESCFDRIHSRFGDSCNYLVIGDGPQEEIAAKQKSWPFWRVSSSSDLAAIRSSLETS